MAVRIKLHSYCYVYRDDLPRAVERDLIDQSTHKDPQFQRLRRMGYGTANLSPYIVTCADQGNRLRFWRGSLGRIIRTLKRHKIEYLIQDRRLWLPRLDMNCTIRLRDYQKPAFRAMVRRQQTLFRGAAGSGKTESLLRVASHFGQPTLVLVWQQRQQKVWLDRIPKYFDFEPGGIGGVFREPRLAPITVGMVQSVRNRLDQLQNLFGCVICDESQRFAADSLSGVVNNLPAAIRLGASDDERRRDGREFLLYDTFGPVGLELKKDQGQCDVRIFAVQSSFKCRPVRHWSHLIDDLIKDQDRNDLIIRLVRREVEAGRQIIIWSDRLDHCRQLCEAIDRCGIPVGLLIGGSENKQESDRTEAGLNDRSIRVGIGTSVAEQSVNIPILDCGIMTCGSADSKLLRFRQMRGRIARPHDGKSEAVLYYVWDKRIWQLRGKLANIKRRYDVKICKIPIGEDMAKNQVTLESLKAGAKLLNIRHSKQASAEQLARLITRELNKDKTYGIYACGDCGRDIIDDLDSCPYCAAKFKPKPADEEIELSEEYETDEESPEAEEDDDWGDDMEEDYSDEVISDQDDQSDVLDDESYEEEEPEPIPDPPKPKRRKYTKKSPEERQSAKLIKEQKEQEKEAKRAQIRDELPYSEEQLRAMKWQALVMVASVAGVKDPVSFRPKENLINVVLKVQAKRFGSK